MSDNVIIKINVNTIKNGNDETLLSEVKQRLSNQPNLERLKLNEERFARFLINKRFSRTPERFKILEKICVENNLFTINTIHGRVLKDMCVDIRTVCRVFNLLMEANIIKRVNESDKNELFKTAYFELIP